MVTFLPGFSMDGCTDFVLATIMALSLSHRSRLTDRAAFDGIVGEHVRCSAAEAANLILCVQFVFAANLKIGPHIALNRALLENAFTMLVCIQLRIPLVLVGKPGSSKSLAKVIVQETLSGFETPEFYKAFKKIEYFSYLCSPHSTSQAISEVFQAAKRSQQQNKAEYAAVLVLDEGGWECMGVCVCACVCVCVTRLSHCFTFLSVGLAEDAKQMPLKVLHTLLDEKAVSFLGISNWALDPAKVIALVCGCSFKI
jgi:E3 ubiquitin-protein ligase RNF213